MSLLVYCTFARGVQHPVRQLRQHSTASHQGCAVCHNYGISTIIQCVSTIYHTMSTIYHNFTGIDIIPYFDSQFPPIIRAGGNGQKGQFCQIGDTRFPESQDRSRFTVVLHSYFSFWFEFSIGRKSKAVVYEHGYK